MRRTNSQWMAPTFVGTVLGLLALSQLSASGRPFGMVDTNFTKLRFTAAAYPSYVNSDGSGGLIWSFVNGPPFDGADGQALGGIVRTTEGGSLDATFATGPSLRDCFGAVVQPDGSMLVSATLVGDVSPNGAPNYRVFRALTNGDIDFNYTSPVFDGPPRFMTLQSDGQLIVAGGGAVNPGGNGGIATSVRLRSNGSLDPDFLSPRSKASVCLHHQYWTTKGGSILQVVSPT
jgi:hypothetical protein